jgi:cellulose synthase/poly-beta-1,6-N-acetylglucosamine synthase-like glycosyltransferase
MAWLFWICAFGAIYSYALYPLILSFLIPRRHAGARSAVSVPKVSLVIACRNEEKRLAAKIENALKLDYLPLEIMVASDASDDGSDTIVQEYASKGVRLVRSPERRGKEHAQGLAIEAATGDIIVFSDAGTDLPPESIRHIVARFADAQVGAVSSEDLFIGADGKLAGEGAYVKYEMWLRRLESDRAGLVGLSGSFFAVRRNVLVSWDPRALVLAWAPRLLGRAERRSAHLPSGNVAANRGIRRRHSGSRAQNGSRAWPDSNCVLLRAGEPRLGARFCTVLGGQADRGLELLRSVEDFGASCLTCTTEVP